MQAIDLRTKQFNVRLNDDEAERLERLAEHFSLSPGNVVRMLIKAKSDELAAAAPPKRRK